MNFFLQTGNEFFALPLGIQLVSHHTGVLINLC